MNPIVADGWHTQIRATVPIRKVSIVAGFTGIENAIAAACLSNDIGDRQCLDTTRAEKAYAQRQNGDLPTDRR
tara:strand:+ start:572 stop:790 length:219 start_codon:yes stop_codon:yes gene_type:complete